MLKTNQPGFVKDPKTGAVLNTDMSNLDAVKRARAAHKRTKAEMDEVKQKLRALEARLEALESKPKCSCSCS